MPTLEEFRSFLLARIDAFGRRDWEAMLGGLPESFEWHFPGEVVDRAEPVRRGALEHSVADLVAQFPDLTVDPVEIVEPAPNSFVARLRVRGAGAASGASIQLEIAQLWEFEDEQPVAVWEFTDVSEALAKARQ